MGESDEDIHYAADKPQESCGLGATQVLYKIHQQLELFEDASERDKPGILKIIAELLGDLEEEDVDELEDPTAVRAQELIDSN